MKTVIALMFGGESVEHDISIITAFQAYNALDKEKYEVLLIWGDKKGDFFLVKNATMPSELKQSKKERVAFVQNDAFIYKKKGKNYKPYQQIHCAVLCFHGGDGENGNVQGLLEMSKIPYTSSAVLGMGITMDKYISKLVFKSLGVKILPYVKIEKQEYLMDNEKTIQLIEEKIGYPCVCKPFALGSSIGISFVTNKTELYKALDLALKFGNMCLIEYGVSKAKEYNISVFYDKEIMLSSIEEPIKNEDILSFNDKYISGDKSKTKKSGTKVQMQGSTEGMSGLKRKYANIQKREKTKIENIALKTYKVLNLSGVVRFDFICEDDEIYLNEINSIPGSLSFYLWENAGISFSVLLDRMIMQAIQRKENSNKLIRSFENSLL